MQWWRTLATYPEGQRFEPYLPPSAVALFIDGFLGPGMEAAW